MEFTLVAFHAHPDDEALLTGGTLARAAAEGHRIVLVTATDGGAGLTSADPSGDADLAARRARELQQAATALGCARVVRLGYADSGSEPASKRGSEPQGGPSVPFSRLDPSVPAERLAEILREERADVLTTYDRHGGYGHPDHVQVHRVGALAAALAGTPVVLEATVDRELLRRAARLLCRVPGLAHLIPPTRFADAYSAREELTHRIDVRRHLPAKRAALAAHGSQATGGRGLRTLRLLALLPWPLRGWVLGHEWYVERGRRPAVPLLDDVFDSVR